mmetsp:Transcript_28588/g.67977  ORF Transcript_28588/g.67977 Transcript_28588/m.67977 type:complete len:207 (-) Transcript_28588:233-853(-)
MQRHTLAGIGLGGKSVQLSVVAGVAHKDQTPQRRCRRGRRVCHGLVLRPWLRLCFRLPLCTRHFRLLDRPRTVGLHGVSDVVQQSGGEGHPHPHLRAGEAPRKLLLYLVHGLQGLLLGGLIRLHAKADVLQGRLHCQGRQLSPCLVVHQAFRQDLDDVLEETLHVYFPLFVGDLDITVLQDLLANLQLVRGAEGLLQVLLLGDHCL